MSEVKLCRDCKHVRKKYGNGDARSSTLWICNRPDTIDLVSGERTARNTYCDWQREGKNGLFSKRYCGKSGIYWEPASPPEAKP